MHRREILGLLTASATGFYSLFARAGDAAPRTLGRATSSTGLAEAADGKGSWRKVGFPDLKRLGRDHQVQSIVYSHGAFCVTTADGGSTVFLEGNLRFKVDSGDAGPLSATPVILPAGDVGDRAWVVFASPDEISSFMVRI